MQVSNNSSAPSYKTLLACMGGNIIEWYDFMIYGYFSSIIAQLFFPSTNKTASLLLSLLVFAIGVIARPIGGILIGHMGDRVSRKKSLILSVYLMFFATALIGLLPTYESIGLWAPLMLFALRIIQGLAMGGEYAGTMVFMVEIAPNERKGLYGSFAALSLVVGMLLASVVTLLIHQFSNEQILAGVWRLPFLLSVLGLACTLYMRRNLIDPSYFDYVKARKQLSSSPFKQMYSTNLPLIIRMILLQTVLAIGMYTITVYFVNYVREYLQSYNHYGFAINLIGMVVLGFSTVLSGWLSDVYGRRQILLWASVLIIFSSFISVYLSTFGHISLYLLSQIILCFAVGQFLGTTPSALAEIFASEIRYTSCAFTNNVAMAIFGGTAPTVIFYGLKLTEDPYVPAYYLTIGAIISFISIKAVYRNSRDSIGRFQEVQE
ncbi:MFS transporter [Candidatus Odyssella thessalonicensis]|uniref:MFS transporter n=1 Tax=Candidatus Odyssella thessalonicensis TaxID=84647 RepID=UPI000225AF5A|nr:MFS transporter [Candidatus Odyssella thessalonicensis]